MRRRLFQGCLLPSSPSYSRPWSMLISNCCRGWWIIITGKCLHIIEKEKHCRWCAAFQEATLLGIPPPDKPLADFQDPPLVNICEVNQRSLNHLWDGFSTNICNICVYRVLLEQNKSTRHNPSTHQHFWRQDGQRHPDLNGRKSNGLFNARWPPRCTNVTNPCTFQAEKKKKKFPEKLHYVSIPGDRQM